MSEAPPRPPKPTTTTTTEAAPPVPPKPQQQQQQQQSSGWGGWFGWGSKPAAEKPKEEQQQQQQTQAQPQQQQQQQQGNGWGNWFGWGSNNDSAAAQAPPSPQIEPLDPSVFKYTGSIPLAKVGERDVNKAKNCYWETSANHFVVRSKTYLSDHVKVESAPSLCRLVSADLLRSKTKLRSYASTPDYPVHAHPDKQFIVVNWTVPTTVPLTFSECFLVPEEETEENKVGLALLRRYMSADESDEFRNNRLKLIPNIVEGPWVVKSAVGKTPAIIGNKLTTTYYRGKNFFEVNIDVGSSYIASGIWGLVSSYVTSLVIDLGLVIQANEVEDLPEHIFGVIRVAHVDLGSSYIKDIPDSYVDVPEVLPPKPPKPAAAPAPAAPAAEAAAPAAPAAPAAETAAPAAPAAPAAEAAAPAAPAEEKPAETA